VSARRKGRPRIEDRANTIEAKKPWLKLEMSRRTWYRRQAEQRKGRGPVGGFRASSSPPRPAITCALDGEQTRQPRGQREGGSRGYWLDSQRFSHGRLEFADAVLELNDMLGRSRRGRDGWREKCEDAKHRHQKLQKLDGDWLAWRAGRILAQIGPCWQGRRKGDLRSRRQRKGRAAFGGRVPAEVINEADATSRSL
jgi:hypothetical protein